jgi:hypothetical protein
MHKSSNAFKYFLLYSKLHVLVSHSSQFISFNVIKLNLIRVKWFHRHDGMVRSRVGCRGDGLQIWRVAGNILNKQSRIADSGWSSNLAVGLELPILPKYLTQWRKNLNVHHRTQHSPTPVPVLRQSNPNKTPQAILPNIHSDPVFLPTPWSSKRSLSFWLSHPYLVHFSLLSHACHMPRPPHSPLLDLPNDIRE